MNESSDYRDYTSGCSGDAKILAQNSLLNAFQEEEPG